MDNGRYSETFKNIKKYNLWVKLFKKNNLMISNYYTGLRPMAWKIYDIQTRPILNYLIRFFSIFPIFFRTLLKLCWMIILYPLICLVYIVCSNIKKIKK